MKLSAYIVRHDVGFSPNAFGGLCTLACCKPAIRRNAERGDIVVGTGSAKNDLSRRLVYAMKVQSLLSFDEYWTRYPSKRPSQASQIKALGDNIWHRGLDGRWICAPGAVHDEGHRTRDLRGRQVLISRDFYYFGRNAIEIPDRFHCLLASTQGHKNTDEVQQVIAFWEWLKKKQPKGGRIGLPADIAEPICDCGPVGKSGVGMRLDLEAG